MALDFEVGSKFECPECGRMCGVHDTVDKSWRHMDFWQHRTELSARVPRVKCPEHGVRQIAVPWARAGSGFTLMMEAFVLLLAQETPVRKVAKMIGEHDTRVWRVLQHYVAEAHARADWSGVRRVLVDETSARKGHRYVSTFVDADTGALLFMAQGKDASAVGMFARALEEHGASVGQIEVMAMDMSRAFMAGAREHFPGARIVFDHFHIMKLAGKAVDEVTGLMRKAGFYLKGQLWALRGNEATRSQEQLRLRDLIAGICPKIGRALLLRQALQEVLASSDPAGLPWWLAWAVRSRLEPFRKLAKTLKAHREGIIAFIETRLTNAAIEAVNGLLQIAKRLARGFRNFDYFKTVAYLKASHLDLHLYPLKTA